MVARERNRTSGLQQDGRGSDRTAPDYYGYTRRRALGYASRKPVNDFVSGTLWHSGRQGGSACFEVAVVKLISRRSLQLIGRSPAHADGHCGRRPQRGKGPDPLFTLGIGHRNIVHIPTLFRGKSAAEGAAPGPQAGNIWNRGPGTHSCRPGGSPSCSLGTGARARYVIGLVNSSYLSCGPHTTYCLSSCLVTSASNVSRFPGGPRG